VQTLILAGAAGHDQLALARRRPRQRAGRLTTQRQEETMKRRTMLAGLAGAAASWTLPAAAQDEFGSKDLIAAAEKEGSLTYYTANFAETEQEVIKAFNKRSPR
jgi:hypothetical protein